MRSLKSFRPLIVVMLFGWLFLGWLPARAASANLSHSYDAIEPISNGSLVSLAASKTNQVELANTSNGQRLLGVSTNSSDSLLAIDAKVGSVQVATTGQVEALVSTLGGDINVGDPIAVSPFSGIGTKATAGSYVIGLAESSFNRQSSSAQSQSVTDTAGHKSTLYVGYVELNIAIGLDNTSTAGGQTPNSLQKLVHSLTGNTVPTWRIILGLVVIAAALAAVISLVYGAIFSSIISIGRNPLARGEVFRTLRRVIGLTVVIAALAVTIVILLLL